MRRDAQDRSRGERPLLAVLAVTVLMLGCSTSGPATTPGTAGAPGGAGTGQAGGGGQAAGAAGSGTAGGGAGAAAGIGGGAAGAGAAGATAGAGTAGASGTSTPDAAPDAMISATDGGAGAVGPTELARPSLGCNKTPAIAKGQFVSATLAGRTTWVRLPATYEPSRAYPVIFIWKGCGATGVASFGMESVAGNEAILAQGDFPPGESCYDTADGAKFVDLPVFDALLASVESNYCVDQAHLYSVGFSSGAWLTFFLGCQRGDVLRGIGTVAGGFKPTFFLGAPQCKGTGLSAFMVSDLDDHENPFFDEDHDGDSVEIGLDHFLVANGCTEKAWTMTNGTASEPDPSLCRSYSGCGRNPVRVCLSHGIGHAPQEKLSMPGFWQLFKQSLPK